jgi:signal transduction histidine kinase
MPRKTQIIGFALSALLGVGALLGAAIWATGLLVERAVERDASRRSIEWARYAAANLPRIDELAAGAPLTASDWEVVGRMADFGDVFRFKIFSPGGILRFVSDDPTAVGRGLGAHNPAAAAVLGSGEPYTVIADGSQNADRPDVYSETYLPVIDESGRVVAIAETYLDQTVKTQAVRHEYLLFGSIMIFLIVLALTGPSAGLFVLFRRLRGRNRELDLERSRAQEADRAKTQFLATISHELRTPMNGIIGAVQLLELSDLAEDDLELLEILKTCSESQMTLIEEILSFGALEAGRMRLSKEEVAIAPAIRAACGFATIASSQKQLSFDIVLPEDAPKVVTDPKRLQQVIVNLVGNAVKFTDRGGVVLRAELSPAPGGKAGTLHIAVTDTGPGIPDGEQARIFERFTQVDESSTRRAGGSGLGLAIARGITRAMGGDISVESRPGEGATFRVELPVDIGANAPTIEERAAA